MNDESDVDNDVASATASNASRKLPTCGEMVWKDTNFSLRSPALRKPCNHAWPLTYLRCILTRFGRDIGGSTVDPSRNECSMDRFGSRKRTSRASFVKGQSTSNFCSVF